MRHWASLTFKLFGSTKKANTQVLDDLFFKTVSKILNLDSSLANPAYEVLLAKEMISHEQALIDGDSLEVRNIVNHLSNQEEVLVRNDCFKEH